MLRCIDGEIWVSDGEEIWSSAEMGTARGLHVWEEEVHGGEVS